MKTSFSDLQPQDIKFLDPCMGSGHILVYAFEVLMQIYESQGWSQRDAAQSILEHNLYGLDIDDRAAQLAYFAVMMKARQYDRRILTRGIRPNLYAIQESDRINRIHLSYLGAGLTELERNDADNQIRGFLDSLEDAKDFGSLLCIDALNWPLLHRFVSGIDHEGQMSMDAVGLEDTCAQLEYLLEVGEFLAQQYDVVVTNPPYMAVSNGNAALNKFVKDNYPDSKGDLFACFMERCGQFTRKDGYQAMITQHAWMFLSSFEKLRAKLLQSVNIVNMAHLGPRAFEEIGGEVVQTTSFVLRRSHIDGYQGTYCRLIEPTTQQGKEEMFLAGENHYTAQQSNFSKIPGAPVAYWASQSLISSFDNQSLSEKGFSYQGIITGDVNHFLRLWYEVGFENIIFNEMNPEILRKSDTYYPYIKGGTYNKWYGNLEYILKWENDGAGLVRSRTENRNYFFRQGITWSLITTSSLSFRWFDKGFLCDVSGSSYFPNNENEILYTLSFLNSPVSAAVLNIINPTINLNIKDIMLMPLIIRNLRTVSNLAEQCVSSSKADWDSYETSWDFKRHPLI